MADEKSRMEMDLWMPFDPALPQEGKLPKKNGVGTGRKIKSRPHFSELGRLKDQKIGKWKG